MYHLEIADSPNVPIAVLKQHWCRPSAEPQLEAVGVYGVVPHFSQEDLLPFEANIERFDNCRCPLSTLYRMATGPGLLLPTPKCRFAEPPL